MWTHTQYPASEPQPVIDRQTISQRLKLCYQNIRQDELLEQQGAHSHTTSAAAHTPGRPGVVKFCNKTERSVKCANL